MAASTLAPAAPAPASAGGLRAYWPRALLLALTLAAFARVAYDLGGKSLWWDETWVIRQCSHGSWKPDKKNPDELKFSPTTWKMIRTSWPWLPLLRPW